MRKAVYLLTVTGIVLIYFYIYIQYHSTPDYLLTKFNSQIKASKFGEIYDESATPVKLSLTREEFIQRMECAIEKLRQIDESLNFQDDTESGIRIGAIKDENSKRGQFTITNFERLDKDGKSVGITIYWSTEGIIPKFYDFYVIPKNKNSEQYELLNVVYKSNDN